MNNPTVLITGATGGLGKGLCRAFIRKNWNVIAHGRNKNNLQNLSIDLPVSTIKADLSNLKEIAIMCTILNSRPAPIDILINNAAVGYGPPKEKRNLTKDGLELRFTVNAIAPYLLIVGLAGSLSRSKHARIINVGSKNQLIHNIKDLQLEKKYSGEIAYQQSKAALMGITQILYERYKNLGIKIDIVHPGTRMPTKIVTDSGVTPLSKLKDGVDFTAKICTCNKYFQQQPSFFRIGESTLSVTNIISKEKAVRIVNTIEALINKTLPSK